LPSADDAGRPQEVHVDLTVAPPTRIATYMHGGDAHFAVDREVAGRMFASVPGGVDAYRAVGRAAQAFLDRAVRYLTVDAGLRQFLVTGCNVSGEPNVHDIAQAVAPEARAVYVLLDPVMVAYAHGLRRSTTEGRSAYVVAKMRDVDEILRQSAGFLDLGEPVAVVMPANLSFIRELATAQQIVDRLMAPLAPGSHLAITHHASDLFVEEHAEMYRTIAELAAQGLTWSVAPRSRGEVAKLFEPVELVEPGVVPMDEWRVPDPDHRPVPAAIHAGVGRKPP
jgi:S-adenosyl methyltransferase